MKELHWFAKKTIRVVESVEESEIESTCNGLCEWAYKNGCVEHPQFTIILSSQLRTFTIICEALLGTKKDE